MTHTNFRRANFLLIGAEKAGCTSVHHYLAQHPEVFLSRKQGANFFSCGDMDLSGRFGYEPSTYTLTLEAYQRLFWPVRQEAAIGEASPSYLCHRRAAERIRDYLPAVRLIALLRQPAERAYSHFLFNRKQILEELEDFRDALAAEDERVARGWHYRYHYRRNGFYYEQLSHYYALFPRHQLLVLLYDDLVADSATVLRQMFQFLEVDDSFQPDTSLHYNVSGAPRNRAIAWGLRTLRPLRRFTEERLPPKLVAKVGRMLLERSPPKPDVLRELTERYREDILKTQELVGRDLQRWLEVGKPSDPTRDRGASMNEGRDA